MGLGMVERKAVTKEMAARYHKASRRDKGTILNELCALTGWNRDYARRALRRALAGERPRSRPQRPVIYGADVLTPLTKIWATMGGPCGKRLAPFMAEMVPAMERSDELAVDPEVRHKLLRISSATIDRLLAPERRRLRVKGRSGTKPGTLLKRHIPIRTFAEWDETLPGFCEVDLVAHDGGNPSGEFGQTVDLTCVNTGWTEMRAVRNKAQRWVFEALQDIERKLPFILRGLDSDNGSEFINDQLFAYCELREITFTRSRPYRKNDSCFVEQKNWSVVRQHVGYARYDTPRELEVLTELYGHLRLWVNFFSPQMKLVEKTRDGAKITRRYDTARTPYQRLMASQDIPAGIKRTLTAKYLSLNPVQLRRDVTRLQDELIRLGRLKERRRKDDQRKEVKSPSPTHPWRTPSRTSLVMQRKASSRAS